MRFLVEKLFFLNIIILYQIQGSNNLATSFSSFETYASDRIERDSLESGKYFKKPHVDFKKFNTQPKIDLNIYVQAPEKEARNYWKFRHQHSYFNDPTSIFNQYHLHKINKSLQDPTIFYQVMKTPYNKKSNVLQTTEKTFRTSYRATTFPQFLPDFVTPSEDSYVLPQKPVRASVIKLETITRPPSFQTQYGVQKPNYYSHAETILNQVLIENNKHLYMQGNTSALFYKQPITAKPKSTYDYINKLQDKNHLNSSLIEATYISPTFSKTKINSHTNQSCIYNQCFLSKNKITTTKIALNNATTHLSIENLAIFTRLLESNKNLFSTSKIYHRYNPKEKNYNKIILNQNGFSETKTKKESELESTTSITPLIIKKRNSSEKFTFSDTMQSPFVTSVTNLTTKKFINKTRNIYDILQNDKEFKNTKIYETRTAANLGDTSNLSQKNFEDKLIMDLDKNLDFNTELSLDAKILKDTEWGVLRTYSIKKASNPKLNNFYLKFFPTSEAVTTNTITTGFTANNYTENTTHITTIPKSMKSNIVTVAPHLSKIGAKQTLQINNKKTLLNSTVIESSTEKATFKFVTNKTDIALPSLTIKKINKENITTHNPLNTTETLFLQFTKRKRRRKSKTLKLNFTTQKPKLVYNRNLHNKKKFNNLTQIFNNKNAKRRLDSDPKDEVMQFSDDKNIMIAKRHMRSLPVP